METDLAKLRQNLVDEKAELDAKIDRLVHFVLSEAFINLPYHDQNLLEVQLSSMRSYSHVLGLRIESI